MISKGININALNGYELNISVASNNTAMVELLFSHEAKVNIRDKVRGFTLLYYACMTNNIKVVNILISHGVDVNDNRNPWSQYLIVIVKMLLKFCFHMGQMSTRKLSW